LGGNPFPHQRQDRITQGFDAKHDIFESLLFEPSTQRLCPAAVGASHRLPTNPKFLFFEGTSDSRGIARRQFSSNVEEGHAAEFPPQPTELMGQAIRIGGPVSPGAIQAAESAFSPTATIGKRVRKTVASPEFASPIWRAEIGRIRDFTGLSMTAQYAGPWGASFHQGYELNQCPLAGTHD
jgi:hypothetical protein